MRFNALIAAAACCGVFAPGSMTAAQRYISTSGTKDNPGTIDQPWDMVTGLSSASPGDIVWIRGGNYSGTFTCWASGTPDHPIIFRQYPGERARIDGGSSQGSALGMQCGNVWLWGMEIFFSDTSRRTTVTGSFPETIHRGAGVTTVQQPGVPLNNKFINLIIHDTRGAFGIWKDAVNAEVYGNVIYNEGWVAPDRGHGHGIYTQNDGRSTKFIRDNIVFNEFSHGFHLYSEQDLLQNFVIEGNVAFDNGKPAGPDGYARNFLVGAPGLNVTPRQIIFRNNFSYYSPLYSGGDSQIGSDVGCSNTTIVDNYFAAEKGTALTKPALCRPVNMSGNTFVGAVRGFLPSEFPANNYYNKPPGGVSVFVRPNRYEAGRANIVVYNWDHSASVSADVSAVLETGDEYEVRDVQNFFGNPVLRGTYLGNKLEIPLGQSATVAVISDSPIPVPHTDSGFGAFVLLVPKRAAERISYGQPVLADDSLASSTGDRVQAVAPGSLVTIFGSGLAGYAQSPPGPIMPFGLGGTSVQFNGEPAQLLYASPEQLNVQVPADLEPGRAVLQVQRDDGASAAIEISVSGAALEVFAWNEHGSAIIRKGNVQLSGDTPRAAPGGAVTLYCTGQVLRISVGDSIAGGPLFYVGDT
jgi:hypothetical protein